MKKRGFTLVELLAVIIVLGLISVIVVPTVTNSIRNYRKDLYEVQISNIEDAARVWGSDNIVKLPKTTNETLVITLSDLQSGGYIDGDVKDPRNKKKLSTSLKITITKTSKGYNYDVERLSGTE